MGPIHPYSFSAVGSKEFCRIHRFPNSHGSYNSNMLKERKKERRLDDALR